MSLKTLVTKSVQYNNWVVNKYIDWLSTKSDEQLNQETISSFPTILKTLHHIWQTQEYWWSFISENHDFDFAQTSDVTQKEDVFNAIKNNSQKLADYVESLSEEDLEKNVKVESPWFQCDFSKYEYIQHAIIHGTYHRGQIVTMGRNIGLTDAPMTDYNFWNIYKDQQ
ncbi:damage-inducible protein DinB [Chryseobacterium piperi]|uniref:Damage-inducible protein DinB n=1 Tax=Chryseobacterium piperi TaxID=558152 RepID=A0A086BB11_9FLAO|nr:DinB family protein [Chryseobacterium piperi]ASW75869.1 damage-inducible protein DinB [Chryseobacterium piperi]KFF26125.1 damage-inducible protein DinB [Chryseobacterium piperi]